MKRRMLDLPSRTWVALGIVLVVAFGFGYAMRGGGDGTPSADAHDHAAESDATMWTCSMHPQIQLPKPGKCPICFMDLIPVESGGVEAGGASRRLAMSESARTLAEIRTAPVERRMATADIRMVGKVDYDETRLAHVTAWVAGRLDRLYVDYTGILVRKGDHMVYMYSPELLATQQELLEALRASERLQRSDQPHMKQTAMQTVQAARDKLRLRGLTTQQIEEIESRGATTDHVTIYAPTGGIVVQKHVTEGVYVDVGERIYTIADLSRVWVLLDAYESDMSWIRYGQEVEFETEAYPGEIFRGRITFIDPVLNAKTRTVKVRVNVDNRELQLKPEMFVRAVVHAHVAGGGRVMDPEFSGKWICPMHPEVVENRAGTCSECGMQLVTAESLGYAAIDTSRPGLMVPASAVLLTGKRAVVYVEVPDARQPTYEGREVLLGPRAGNFYQVKSGLAEGERVVVNGSFKIDSALQIQARPSMMNPEGGATSTGHEGHGVEPPRGGTLSPTSAPTTKPGGPHGSRLEAPARFMDSLSPLFDGYFALQDALAQDDLNAATASFERVHAAAQQVPMNGLSGDAHAAWMDAAQRLTTGAQEGSTATNLDAARSAFERVSLALLTLEERFGHPGDATHYRIHCPMAFDNKGADWIQTTKTVHNPYFGASMLRCGELTQELAPRGAAARGETR